MEISDLTKHSLSQAFQQLEKSPEQLQPFSYVIRDGVANVLGKADLDPDAAVERLKSITQPLPGLSHYSIVWEAPFQNYPRAIFVECGSADLDMALTLVQPFMFKKKGFLSKRTELVSAGDSVLSQSPPSRIYQNISAA